MCAAVAFAAEPHQIAMDEVELHGELNRTEIETIFADLELALTFADRASLSDNPETCVRNRANAREAYFQIRDKFLPRCSPDDFQRARIDEKLRELRHRLKDLGENFED
jgi:hypothetical protein